MVDQVDIFRTQYQSFESIWRRDENGVEFIYARELQSALGYKEWRKFLNVIEKASISCANNGNDSSHHFVGVAKMVQLGSGSEREIQDIQLTRYACYLVAQNGDPRKKEIAFAQNYFAVQTRNLELIIERMNQVDRLDTREKLKESESEFGRAIFERGVKGDGFAFIRSAGDKALFGGNSTQDMKDKLKVPKGRGLADFTNPLINTAKDLANRITTANVVQKDLEGQRPIQNEHVDSNENVREALVNSGIYPESLPPEEDIRKVERRIAKENKALEKGGKKQIV